MSAERVYNTSKASSEILVCSLLGGTKLIYVAHKSCARRASRDRREHQESLKTKALTQLKELAYRAVLNCLQKATDNGAWLTAIPHHLNGTELSWG